MRISSTAALALALIVIAMPSVDWAQQPAPPEKKPIVEEKISADEAFKRGEQAHEKQNFAEAMHWYRIAADQGHAQAQVHVGNLYTDGEGVTQDYAEALRWFHKAADLQDYEAENNIGFFYLSGWGVQQDYAQAMQWFRKAADKGNEVAQRNVAMMYLKGLGVPADKDEAIRWFKKAAAAGDEDSKDALQELGAE